MPPRKAGTKDAAPPAKPKANTKAKITKRTNGKGPVAKVTDTVKAETKKPATTKSATKKAAAARASTKAKAEASSTTAAKAPSKKRKAEEDDDDPAAEKTQATTAASKKRKVEEREATVQVKKARLTKGAVINQAPTQRLHVFVFGEGTAGELGLGTAKNAVDVKRPRLNPNLAADTVGVVQIAAGGMHVVALTHDNKLLTWGVNDQGALGRDTDWDGGLRDMDAEADSDSDDDNDDNGLNPKESTPGEVDFSGTEVAEGVRFVSIAAGDSTSFAVTDDGRVYGWGTFRSNDGICGFVPGIPIASRPVLLPDLKNITSVQAGANHALALDNQGLVFAWGNGQQNQLGRRVVERTKESGLQARQFGLPKGPKKGIKAIATGDYHSFAISKNGDVYSWGLNNFGETGIPTKAGEDDAVILKPQVIEAFKGKNIVSIKGAAHHSIAATDSGDCLVWGRLDASQMGIPKSDIAKMGTDAVVKDEHNHARIILLPQKVNAINGAVDFVTASSDHSFAVTRHGKAWSWGFSANYQTGQGTTDDVEVATMIDNTAVRERKIVGAAAGGQYSILTAIAD